VGETDHLQLGELGLGELDHRQHRPNCSSSTSRVPSVMSRTMVGRMK
jgi:hypothetical protein